MGPRESLRMILKPHYEIKTADSARGALDQLPEFRPDLVVLDIKMPEIDGLEVLRRIKRIDPTIEVVMITAYASLETVKLALSHGAFEYLIKPFSRQDLEQVVRRAVERRQADQGTRGQVARLVEEMRSLSAKTLELEEAARREPAEQSLRVTQLSILREMSRTIVGQLDLREMTAAVTDQLRRALDYDAVSIIDGPPAPEGPAVVVCAIRDAGGSLGHLVVDNRASGGRSIAASASCSRCWPSTSPSPSVTRGSIRRSPRPSARSNSSSTPRVTRSSRWTVTTGWKAGIPRPSVSSG